MAGYQTDMLLCQTVSFLIPLYREGSDFPENHGIAIAEYRFKRNKDLKEFEIGEAKYLPTQDSVQLSVRFFCYLEKSREEFQDILASVFNRIHPLHRYEFEG